MTRLFNIGAAALLIGAIWFSFGRSPLLTTPAAAQAALVAAATKAGLIYDREQTIVGGERLLLFKQRGCAALVGVLYLPSVTHISSYARQAIAASGHSSLVVYDGAVVAGISFRDVAWPWLGRKLAMTVGLAPRDPWSSTLIVALIPDNCLPPAIDWRQFGPHE